MCGEVKAVQVSRDKINPALLFRGFAIGLALLLLGFPPSAQGQEPGESEVILSGWLSQLQGIQQQLLEEGWTEALEASSLLLEDVVDKLKAGEDSAGLLALAVAQQAVAEAGLGRMEDAIWHFHEAQNFNPEFRTAPLSAFGTAGEALESHRLRGLGQGGRFGSVGRFTGSDQEIDPPRLLESPFMVFRASAEVLRAFPRDLRVEVIIDTEGRAREPVVTGSMINPSPIRVSLEVLRDWRFEPATLAGRPVPVFYELALPLTRGATERAREELRRSAPEG